MIFLVVQANRAETEGKELGRKDAGGRTAVHQHADERAGLASAQFKADERGDQVQQLKVDKNLGNSHFVVT